MFTKQDTKFFKLRGINEETINRQIQNFIAGFPYSNIQAPATVGNGIIRLDDASLDESVNLYNNMLTRKEVVKFVPASGAASRMFKSLFAYRDEALNMDGEKQKQLIKSHKDADDFIEHIKYFAFFDELKEVARKQKLSIDELIDKGDFKTCIELLISETGLHYDFLPKGLLLFHNYKHGARTPFEEHLVEGINYALGKDRTVKLHFTVSSDHLSLFSGLLEQLKPKYESEYNVSLEVTFSLQKPSTDTIAVDMENKPFRDPDGSLLFRPGGHGALIENLNDTDADIIFIKNIDNVLPDNRKQTTVEYKKALGGLLVQWQEKIFDALRLLLTPGNITEKQINDIFTTVFLKLYSNPGDNYQAMSKKEKVSFLFGYLNRPLRVCGMVKNEGEPGGGPFWVKMKDDRVSLQIVETSQIDTTNPEKQELISRATHFNPVDLVCAVKDFKGNKFNFLEYVDPSAGFISKKSKDGRELKAQELPGLWNGAMAFWNTIFVEVPLDTFSPVKKVTDLLRSEHQD